MKSLIQLSILAIMTLGLSSCDPFEGLLQVKKSFNIITKLPVKDCNYDFDGPTCQPSQGGETKTLIPVGDYKAKLDFLGRDKMEITLNINGHKTFIKMDLPARSIPSNGSFTISAKELGQKFSAEGDSVTTISDSQPFRGYEQCTYSRYETVCRYVNGRQDCYQELRTIYGQQRVEFFNRHTQEKLNVSFIDSMELATFSGQRSSSEKIYTFKDYCF